MQDARYKIKDKTHASCRAHRGEKGIALVMVLILSTIALAIMAGLIYMLTSGTQISGFQKRYKTALEGGFGGADITYKVMDLKGDSTLTNQLMSALNATGLAGAITTNSNCTGITAAGTSFSGVEAKFNTPTTSWVNCNSNLTITPPLPGDPDNSSYDMRFELGTTPQRYRIYSKIINTMEGNSGGGESLQKGGVINVNSGEVPVVSMPYLYTVEIDAENMTNPSERAKLSILYQY